MSIASMGDGDNKEEYTVGDMFSNFDKNRDGVLSWDEIWTAIKPMHAKLKK